MDAVMTPTPEAYEQAKAEYRRITEVLLGMRRALDRPAQQALVGKCFKRIEALRDDPSVTWPVYVAVTHLDEDRLAGWHFQSVPTGQIELAPDGDLQHGFLTESCIEVPRAEFVVAFNELLTTIARYANRMPS